MWRGSRARLPPEVQEGTQALGQWRLAVERRERTLRWAALLATEGQEEPSSIIADERRRFDYLAELVAILAERSDAAKQVRSLGERLISGIWESTIDPVLDNRRPLSVVRLAYAALADLIFDDLTLGFVLQMHLSKRDGHSLHGWCIDGSLAMRMVAAYLHAVLGLSSLPDVKGTSMKIPVSLIPMEAFGEDVEIGLEHEAEPATPPSSTKASPEDVRSLCQTLTGSWRGYYVYPMDGARDEEMRLTLNITKLGVVTGEGKDQHGTFTVTVGKFQFDRGLLSFNKSYSTHSLPYCGMITSNGIAGTWGDRHWGGTFMIWRDGEDTEEFKRAQREGELNAWRRVAISRDLLFNI
jgi:hypothetical protein